MKDGDKYMMPEDAEELLEQVTEFVDFHKKLGKIWTVERDKWASEFRVRYYDLLPGELVDMLDEIAGVHRCETAECRRPCYLDWDFCAEHGAVPHGSDALRTSRKKR
jgi:hypothetical protein